MTGYVAANFRATEAPVPGPTPAMMAGGEGAAIAFRVLVDVE